MEAESSVTQNNNTVHKVQQVNDNICFYRDVIIGYGSNGTVVYKGEYEDKKYYVAVKRVLKTSATFDKREIQLLKEANHENVVRYFCTAKDKDFIYIVLELCDVTLKDFMGDYKEYKTYHKDDIYIGILEQIGKGLGHVHDSLNILHRDLKPSNVLIKFEKVSATRQVIKAKLSDFGISRQITKADKTHYTATDGTAGSSGWKSPEVLKGVPNSHITKAIDIFAYGCLVHFVLMSRGQRERSHPFGYTNDLKTLETNVKKGNRLFFLSSDKSRSTNTLTVLADIAIQEMVNPDASKRPSIENVLKYPLFWNSAKQLQFIATCFTYDTGTLKYRSHFIGSAYRYIPDWVEVLNSVHPTLLAEISKKKRLKKYSNSPYDLLRCIRNINAHFGKITHASAIVNIVLGENEREMMDFFNKHFPTLIPLIWFTFRSLSYQNTDPGSRAVREYYADLENMYTITVRSLRGFLKLSKIEVMDRLPSSL